MHLRAEISSRQRRGRQAASPSRPLANEACSPHVARSHRRAPPSPSCSRCSPPRHSRRSVGLAAAALRQLEVGQGQRPARAEPRSPGGVDLHPGRAAVEITAEFENWRRIRDAEGSEGWVQQGLLSSRRTALVAPWRRGQTFDLRARASSGADLRARLEAGVLVLAAVVCRRLVPRLGRQPLGERRRLHGADGALGRLPGEGLD